MANLSVYVRYVVEPIAYYVRQPPTNEFVGQGATTGARNTTRVVVSLQQEMRTWLQSSDEGDTIRVISGGPGSGKSSFVRILAADLVQSHTVKVVYIPLHLIDASKDLTEEVGRFVKDEGILLQNPLDRESPEPNLLIIFDGLDELASQGKAAAETARAFVREVEKMAQRRNLASLRLRILISGREVVVQDNESEFRQPRQILTILPYFTPEPRDGGRHNARNSERYSDEAGLLKTDLRQQWWKRYGALTGNNYKGLPTELNRPDLEEVTSQPLLNYLLALTFSRRKLDFKKDINLNSIYGDLLVAVYERGYEKRRHYAPIKQMSLSDFSRVLEEIGLAAWHGDGRTTTVREIEEHCRTSGVAKLLEAFEEGARAGVTRLLAAFFFRQYGQRQSGDPTFVFTHKSFGEYLAARRIVRAVEKIIRELDRRIAEPDEGWDEKTAIKYWVQVCGPNAITRYIHVFLLNEFKLRHRDELLHWQEGLAVLFSYALVHGTPMEQLQLSSFREMVFQARNAEEALLVALNACARQTNSRVEFNWPDVTTFGTWFRKIQGQRTGPESVLAAGCLSFLDLKNMCFDIADLYGADLWSSDLRHVSAYYTTLGEARLVSADLRGAHFAYANFELANLSQAKLQRAKLEGAIFARAGLGRAKMRGAILSRANLKDADLTEADLSGASLDEADLTGATLERAKLINAKFTRAKLNGVNFEGCVLTGANFDGAILDGSNIDRARLNHQSNRSDGEAIVEVEGSEDRDDASE